MTLPGNCHNHEAQPSQGTERIRDEAQSMTKQSGIFTTTGAQTGKIRNRGTTLERSLQKITEYISGI